MKQVGKIQARKAYANGQTVYLNPCGLIPNFGPIGSRTIKIEPEVSGPFGDAVDVFKANECNSETGRYPHYYIS